MKVYMIALLLISSLSSCEDKQEDFVRDTSIEMSFSDENGNDLLDPAVSGSFNSGNTDLFYLKDGQQERVNNGNMDSPENFSIFYAGDQYLMRLTPSEYVKDGLTTTYLQFNKADTDTIVCQLRNTGENTGSIVATKVWYNDVLVWDGNGPRYFEIKK